MHSTACGKTEQTSASTRYATLSFVLSFPSEKRFLNLTKLRLSINLQLCLPPPVSDHVPRHSTPPTAPVQPCTGPCTAQRQRRLFRSQLPPAGMHCGIPFDSDRKGARARCFAAVRGFAGAGGLLLLLPGLKLNCCPLPFVDLLLRRSCSPVGTRLRCRTCVPKAIWTECHYRRRRWRLE